MHVQAADENEIKHVIITTKSNVQYARRRRRRRRGIKSC
jgi:hypothetical protein